MNVSHPSAGIEEHWGNAGMVCLVNFFVGFMVTAVTGFPAIALVPIVASAAGALANGIYCFTGAGVLANDYYRGAVAAGSVNRYMAASFFADVAWLVQAAGLQFYSYLILVQILRGGPRLAFLVAFWALMTGIATVRTTIAVYRLRSIADDADAGPERQILILRLHVGFFSLVALVEVISSFILLVKLKSASRISTRAAIQNKSSALFRHIMRSTVARVGILALVGITRAITSYFSIATQDPNSTASVLDSCAYIAECAFPLFM